ncbi:hypothetical protein SCHPADRAFT_84478 [Schizopora paradoxa]|uniref:Uncharacterized protein n=1 Tax=Schizopora paradoxa TaxID=27342 RepID=A0A0H2SBZ5_9AGAM|nr:hypothetical protein SCHPADRAFT_84478 [Schizopora paradoxa]
MPMHHYSPASQIHVFPVEDLSSEISASSQANQFIANSKPQKRRNFMRNPAPCEGCSSRRVRVCFYRVFFKFVLNDAKCVYIRQPGEGVAPLCVACQKKNMAECGPHVSKKKKTDASTSVADATQTPADSPLHSPLLPVVPIEEAHTTTASRINDVSTSIAPGEALTWGNDLLPPSTDDVMWQWLLSTYATNTAPPTVTQGYTQTTMYDQRVSNAFATDELLNALPQFYAEGQNAGVYVDNLGLSWWTSEGSGQMG